MLISADIFLGMADITDFLVNTRCWGPAYVADKIQSIPAFGHSLSSVALVTPLKPEFLYIS